ncbi:MAG: amidase family protein [Peptococcaceae bacterium]|nr:amidase family protein [Peptococcaceae bacterium]
MHTLDALTLANQIRRRDLTAFEVAKHTLSRIDADTNNCFLYTTPETALVAAKRIDARLEQGDCPSPLAGVPIAIDDTILVRGDRCTAGSRMLDNFISPFNATVIDKILAAGLIPVGRTNTDEFGVCGSGDTCYHGITLNPLDSSNLAGAAAAAISSRLVPLALCADTLGAQRKFASQTGTIFLKPTYGKVSRFGLVPYISSAEQIGAAGATIGDTAALLNIIAGYDPKDGTGIPNSDLIPPEPSQDLRHLRIGIATDYWTTLGRTGTATLTETRERLTALGATLQDCPLPQQQTDILGMASMALQIIAAAEGCNNFSRYDGIKFGYRPQTYATLDDISINSRSESFGREVKKTILFGSFVLAQQQYEAYYLQALKIRRLIQQQLAQALQTYDCLLIPASTGQPYHKTNPEANARQCLTDTHYTAPATLAGYPAVAAPSPAVTQERCGIQFIAAPNNEQILFDIVNLSTTDSLIP